MNPFFSPFFFQWYLFHCISNEDIYSAHQKSVCVLRSRAPLGKRWQQFCLHLRHSPIFHLNKILLECILLRTHRHACTCSHAMYLWGTEMPLHWLRAGRQDIESLKRGFAFLQRRLTLCWLVQSGVCLIPVIEQFLERGESDKGGNGVPLGNAIDMAQTLPAK